MWIQAVLLGFAACFWLGRCYEAEYQDRRKRRGTLYRVDGRGLRTGEMPGVWRKYRKDEVIWDDEYDE